MDEQTIYNNLFELYPQYPLTVLEFFKNELQLGKRYVVLDVHQYNGQISKLLQKHVHLVCSLSTNANYQQFLKDKLRDAPNFLSIHATPELTNIEEDSIDCLCIDETFNSFDVLRMGIEFERILRLNSYVLMLHHQLIGAPNTFSQAYASLLEDEKIKSNFLTTSPSPNRLNEFYTNGYQQRLFPIQQRFDWEQLELYFKTILALQQKTINPVYFARLKYFFDEYQRDGQVILEYQTELYYGLFNYSVPEISLRKSLFFNLLRPFAFGFYILVKANIYFWKGLIKLKEKLFG